MRGIPSHGAGAEEGEKTDPAVPLLSQGRGEDRQWLQGRRQRGAGRRRGAGAGCRGGWGCSSGGGGAGCGPRHTDPSIKWIK